MKVKVLENKLRDFDPGTNTQHDLKKGDVVEVSDETGWRWCGYGWAKDVAGKHPTGKRIPGPQAIIAHDATLTQE